MIPYFPQNWNCTRQSCFSASIIGSTNVAADNGSGNWDGHGIEGCPVQICVFWRWCHSCLQDYSTPDTEENFYIIKSPVYFQSWYSKQNAAILQDEECLIINKVFMKHPKSQVLKSRVLYSIFTALYKPIKTPNWHNFFYFFQEELKLRESMGYDAKKMAEMGIKG